MENHSNIYPESHILSAELVSALQRRIETNETNGYFDCDGRLQLSLHYRESGDFQGVFDMIKPMIDNPEGVRLHANNEGFARRRENFDGTFVLNFAANSKGGIQSASKVNGAYCFLRSESGVCVDPGDFWLVRFVSHHDRCSYVEPLKLIYSRDGYYHLVSRYEARYSLGVRRTERTLSQLRKRCSGDSLQYAQLLSSIAWSPNRYFPYELPAEYKQDKLCSGLNSLIAEHGEHSPVLLPIYVQLAEVEHELGYSFIGLSRLDLALEIATSCGDEEYMEKARKKRVRILQELS